MKKRLLSLALVFGMAALMAGSIAVSKNNSDDFSEAEAVVKESVELNADVAATEEKTAEEEIQTEENELDDIAPELVAQMNDILSVDTDSYDIEKNENEYCEETLEIIADLQKAEDDIYSDSFNTEGEVRGLSGAAGYDEVFSGIEAESVFSGTYGWISDKVGDSNLTHDDKNQTATKIYGIDVYHGDNNDKPIDWEKVKSTGVKFVIIKLGYRSKDTGKLYTDPMFTTHVVDAYNAGLKIGVYYFSQDLNVKEAKASAAQVIKWLEPYRSMITLPVFYDMEDCGGRYVSANMTREVRTDMWITFCDAVKASGYTPGTYGSVSSYFENYNDPATMKNYSTKLLTYKFDEKGYYKWVARYRNYLNVPYSYGMWQYSDRGIVSGIAINYSRDANGNKVQASYQVDLDVMYVQGTPAAPTGVKQVSNVNATELTFKWNTVTYAGGYFYVIKDAAGNKVTSGTVAAEGGTRTQSKTVTGLQEGAAYSVYVRAFYSASSTMNGTKINGKYASAVKMFTPPAIVTDETVGTNTGTSVTAKWTATKGASGYLICWYDESNTKISSAVTTSTSYTISGLTPMTNYKTRVIPYALINGTTRMYASTYSEYLPFTTSTVVVTGLAAAVPSSTAMCNQVNLKWTLQTGSEGYQITCYDYATKKWSAVAEVDGTTNTYSWTGLKASTTYAFRVRSFFTSTAETCVYGPYCTSVKYKTRPAKVDGVTISGTTTTSITLKWNAAAGANGYRIYRLNTSTGKYECLSDQTTTTYTNSKLSTAKKYKYNVVAYSLNGTTRYYGASNVYEAATSPAKASGLKFEKTGIGDTYFTPKWTKVSGASGYRVRVYKNDGTTLVQTVYAKSYTTKIADLNGGTTYKVKVQAYVQTETGKRVYGSYSSLVGQTTRAKATTISVKSLSTSAIAIQWNKVTGATGYRVYSYNPTTKEYTLLKSVSNTTFTYTRSGLSTGKTYYFSVRPFRTYDDFSYMSAYSEVFAVATRPGTVTGLKNTKVTTDSATFTWTKVTGANQYKLYCYSSAGKLIKSGYSITNSITLSSLPAGTYTFKVRAIRKTTDYSSFGGYSTGVTLCTTPAKVGEINISSQVFNAEAGNATTTLSWAAVANATGYKVELIDATTQQSVSVKAVSANSVAFTNQAIDKSFIVRVTAYTTVSSKKYYGVVSDDFEYSTSVPTE